MNDIVEVHAQLSAEENDRMIRKLTPIQIEKEKVKIKKAKTLKNIRRDRFGKLIKRGGKHRICFRDKIDGEKNKLCDIINITLINKERSYISGQKSNSIENGNQVEIKIKDDPKNFVNSLIQKSSTLKSSTEQEKNKNGCSCACIIY